ELAAQPGHVDVDGPGLDEPVAAPDQIEQLVATEYPAGCPDERGQQLELLGREAHGSPGPPDLQSLPVRLRPAGPGVLVLPRRVTTLAATRDGANPRHQLAR